MCAVPNVTAKRGTRADKVLQISSKIKSRELQNHKLTALLYGMRRRKVDKDREIEEKEVMVTAGLISRGFINDRGFRSLYVRR